MNQNKRGRPVYPFALPSGSRQMTINDIWAANPHIKCRLSIYNKVKRLVQNHILKPTDETEPTGSMGKPLTVYETTKQFNHYSIKERVNITQKAIVV